MLARRLLSVVVTGFLADTAVAFTPEEQDARRACISEHVVLSSPEAEDVGFGQWQFYADVTNNLDWAISGLRIDFALRSPGRSVAWLNDDASQSIPGGVEPGETRKRVFLTNTQVPQDTPADVILEIVAVDVADADGNQYVNDVTVIGGNWTNKLTSLECGK